MKVKLVVAAVGALMAGGVQAQNSGVTVYGLMDTGIEYLTNAAPAGNGLTRIPNLTGTLPSRIGFRGTEDLGGGLRALFNLENGFSPDSGTLNQGGRLFGRMAFVGLSNQWGTVTLGRQNTMLFWSILDSDILGPNIYGSASLDNYIPNARSDNSIAYRGTFGGLTVGATYTLGRDAVNAGPSPSGTNCAGESATDERACRGWSAMVKYDSPVWGGAVAYDTFNGGPGAFAGLTSSSLSDTRATVNGYVRIAKAKIGAGVIQRDNEANRATPKTNLYFVGASYPLTPALTLDGELFQLDAKDSPNEATLFAIRGMYAFSKRTQAYVTAGHIRNDGAFNISASGGANGGNPVAGGSQTGVMIGVRHFF